MIRKMLIAAAALIALMASPAFAQYDFGVDPGVTTPGGSFTASGKGCAPGSTVTITVFEGTSTRAAGDIIYTTTGTADDKGEFSIVIKLPANTPVGTYTVEARCPVNPNLDPNDPSIQGTVVNGELIFTSTIEVKAAEVEKPGGGGGVDEGEIVRTGSDLNNIGLVGAGLLAVGGLVLIASRRRGTAEA